MMFVSLIGYLVFFNFHSDKVQNSPYNRRQDSQSTYVRRGDILDSKNNVLATTQVDANGKEIRVYPYSNMFSKRIMDLYPGRWAEFSGSDAHSLYTAGYNWTEFPGNSEEDFRKAILHKKTVAKGVPAPVLGQVQWSMEVVWGGQKLMYKALRRKLEPVPDNALVEKILSNTDLKNATGIAMGFIYLFPLTSMLATLLSTAYLKNHAKKAMKHIDERIAKIQKLIAEVDACNGKAIAQASEDVRNDLEAGKIVLEQRL